MSSSSHYIRTIHTSFTSTSAHRPHQHSNILLNFSGPHQYLAQNAKYPPGLGPAPSGASGRRRASAISSPSPHTHRAQPASVTHMKFDPFADEPLAPPPSSSRLSPIIYSSPLPPRPHSPSRVRPASIPYTIQIPAAAPSIPPPIQAQRDLERARKERLRTVAGLLLTREMGKPMRRRLASEEKPREYVKSCLSRVVTVDA